MQLTKLIAKLLSFMLVGLRPMLGPATCKFPVSCGNFALEALQEKPLHHALYAIAQRLLSCISLPSFHFFK